MLDEERTEPLVERLRRAREKLLENQDLMQVKVAKEFREADEKPARSSTAYWRFGCY